MEQRTWTWIVVADDRRARLLRGTPFGSGRSQRLRLERVDELQSPWCALEPSGNGASRAERATERLLRLTEFRQRFAGEIGRWLGEQVREHGIGTLELFAPPRLAVMLRREYPPDLAQRVTEHRTDIGNLALERLESSPELFALFRSAAG